MWSDGSSWGTVPAWRQDQRDRFVSEVPGLVSVGDDGNIFF
jgi:hypothetical protein